MRKYALVFFAGLGYLLVSATHVSAQTLEERLAMALDDLEARMSLALDGLEGDTGLAILDLQAQIDDLQAQINAFHPRTGFTCADLAFSGDVWGEPAEGLDLRPFTNSTLHFIGCFGAECDVLDFFCEDDPIAGTLTFGSTEPFLPDGRPLRAQVDIGDVDGDRILQLSGCSSSTSPSGVSNIEPDDATASAICQALGYRDGTSTDGTLLNSCPQASPLAADGSDWGLSNLSMSFLTTAQQIHCTGG